MAGMDTTNDIFIACFTALGAFATVIVALFIIQLASNHRRQKNYEKLFLVYQEMAAPALRKIEELWRKTSSASGNHEAYPLARALMDRALSAGELDQVEHARSQLRYFWEYVCSLDRHHGLPAYFWKSEEIWMSEALRYMQVVEPLDIATFYSCMLPHSGGPHGHYLDGGNRSSQFVHIEKVRQKHSVKPKGNSLALAEKIKSESNQVFFDHCRKLPPPAEAEEQHPSKMMTPDVV